LSRFRVLLLAASAAVLPAQIQVGANVQVSRSRSGWAHYETWIAADSGNAGRLLGASMALNPETGQYESIVYASSDGGATWTETLRSAQGYMTGDPVPVLGPGGRGYFLTLPLHRPGPNEMLMYRSENSGSTWSEPVHLPFLDREAASVDATGRLYVQGTDPGGNGARRAYTLLTSTDQGRTFSPPVRLEGEANAPLIAGNSVIASDGSMFTVFAQFSPERNRGRVSGNIRVTGTVDHGASLLDPLTIAPFQTGSAFSVPGIAVDNSTGPFAGRLYATWVSEHDGRTCILAANSQDRGKSWSEPIAVNDDPVQQPAPEHTMPVIAVNTKGVVGLVWYDRREFRGAAGFRVRFAASRDGGKSFLPSMPVSEQPYSISDHPLVVTSQTRPQEDGISIDLRPAQFTPRAGDTAGMAADANGIFHPLWIDNRTGIPQAWTARVTVADLTEITERVSVSLSEITTVIGARRVTAKLRLKNTSTQPILPPIVVRVAASKADLGDVHPDVVTWRVDEALNPGEWSRARELVFDVSGPFDPVALTPTFKLASLVIKVYTEK
jgi:hypothetical protein